MATLGFIERSEADAAMKEEFKLGGVSDMLNLAPYFVEHIRQFLEKNFGSSKIYHEGLKVYTTLNLNDQQIAQQAVKNNLRVADKRYGYRGPIDHVNNYLTPATNDYINSINEYEEGQFPLKGDIVKGVVTGITDMEAQVNLGLREGTINIKNMSWARKPNIKVDGRWAKINKPSQALKPGDVIYVKVLDEREAQGLDLGLEQEPEVQAGLINIHPSTGNIKAMIGGYDYSQSKFNRAVQAIRQPGSAFKPIIYLTALKEGFTPASIILDSPVIFKERDETFDKWKPANYEQKFYGPTPMRTALAHSRNVVTIKLLQSVGIKKAIRMARSLGITSRLEPNLSIALGSSGVTLMELVSAYSVFPNQGYRNEPNAVRYIKNRDDELIYTHQPVGDQVISSGLAYLITSLMESVVQNGTGSKVKVLNRPVAGKTGTTNNFIDAWFLGYTANSVTGVWVGKDKDEALGVNETGSRAAIPIWLEYMKKTLAGKPVYNFPASREVIFAKINEETGYMASYGDPKAKFESFLRTNLPQSPSQSEVLTNENTF
jgi:penicillin-binding protein 1A